MVRILLTNDDGIHAPGLSVLEEIARTLSDDIWICAPAEEQSGAGHSLSLNRPVRLHNHGPRRYSVTGTPTDSVMLALRSFMQDGPPDLILSGVNRGANVADDITYSGTVAAAMEGALAGIPAIALSQVFGQNADHDLFDAAKSWGEQVLRPLLDLDFAPRTLINVNFPACSAGHVKGVKTTTQGFHDYSRAGVVEAHDPHGRPYYWFSLKHVDHSPEPGTDLAAVADHYIAVTPLTPQLTHQATLCKLEEIYAAKG